MRLFLLAALSLVALRPPLPSQEESPADRLLNLIERRHRETADPGDPRAAAARLGFDHAKILDFVRTDVSWEPYAGILRDASGTLLVRAGNSIDRALLLQAMLESCGEKTRLMRVDLAEAEGAKLLETFLKRERKSRSAADPKDLARDLGVDAGALEAVVTERRRAESDLVDEVLEAAKGEAARLAPIVGPIAGRAVSAPREHVWVQGWDGAKKDWTDLDASPVEISHKGGRILGAPEIASQRRTVTLRLLLNRKSGEKIEPVPLLVVPSDLAALSWKAVDLVVQPVPGQLPAASKLRDLDAKGLVDAFRQVKQYRPGLIVDGKSFGGIPFDLDGKTYDVDAGGRVGPAKALAGGLNRAFGGALGGGGQAAPAASALESVVLEISVKEPGSAERIHRRTLVTASKSDARALPILRTSFLVDAAPLPAGERGRRELAAMARNAPALRKLLKGQLEGIHFNQHVEVSSLLLRFGELRRRVVERLDEGTVFLQDRPGLVAETSQVFLDEEAGKLLHRRGIDILDNPGYVPGAADRTMAIGLAETALECLLVERGWPGEARRSAWTIMERARLSGGKGEASDRDGRREVRWSPDAWWSIDPATGGCVGRVPSGAGQGLIEAAWEQASAVCTYSDVVGFAAGMAGAAKISPAGADDAASLFGKACGVVGGTWARDAVNDKINEITQGLWTGAIAALSGM